MKTALMAVGIIAIVVVVAVVSLVLFTGVLKPSSSTTPTQLNFQTVSNGQQAEQQISKGLNSTSQFNITYTGSLALLISAGTREFSATVPFILSLSKYNLTVYRAAVSATNLSSLSALLGASGNSSLSSLSPSSNSFNEIGFSNGTGAVSCSLNSTYLCTYTKQPPISLLNESLGLFGSVAPSVSSNTTNDVNLTFIKTETYNGNNCSLMNLTLPGASFQNFTAGFGKSTPAIKTEICLSNSVGLPVFMDFTATIINSTMDLSASLSFTFGATLSTAPISLVNIEALPPGARFST